MVPKAFSLAIALPRQLTARRLAGCCRVDARFTLAMDPGLWTLAFWTSVPSDTCRHRHWSLSALVTVGAGWCEKPVDQPPSIQHPIPYMVQTKHTVAA
jgi:hypothetical protein